MFYALKCCLITNVVKLLRVSYQQFYCRLVNISPMICPLLWQLINSKYIVPSAPQHIGCSLEVSASVGEQLDPPYEDLFDEAEEFSLSILLWAWEQLLISDSNTFQKVPPMSIHHIWGLAVEMWARNSSNLMFKRVIN